MKSSSITHDKVQQSEGFDSEEKGQRELINDKHFVEEATMTSYRKDDGALLPGEAERKLQETSSGKITSTVVRNIAICFAFVAFETGKQVVTYGTKEYNNGKYPIPLSTIVVLIEMVKLLIVVLMFGYQGGLKTIKLSWRFAIPSLLYGMNNNIYLYALHFTPPPIWNVLIQSRVMMTALVYRIIFKRMIPTLRWVALFLLVFGIALAEFSGASSGGEMEGSQLTVILGAICLSVVSAGLSTAASIYTEYLFKTDRRPFFEQQIQLYLFGVLITGVWATYITKGNPFVVEGNLSVTLLWLLILTIFLGGAGGLLVAAIIKNIDNIAKIYASTIAILVTGVVCWILFPENFQMTVTFVLAICMILASSVLYERAKPKEPDETSNKNGSKPTVLSKENVSLNSAPEHKI